MKQTNSNETNTAHAPSNAHTAEVMRAMMTEAEALKSIPSHAKTPAKQVRENVLREVIAALQATHRTHPYDMAILDIAKTALDAK